MNKLFIGTNAFNYRQVGCIDDFDGKIYQGQSTLGGRLIGTIEAPYIFQVNGYQKEKIGRYSQGNVYRLNGSREELIGNYDARQQVYKGSGGNCRQIGHYEGSPSGAAALLLLFD